MILEVYRHPQAGEYGEKTILKSGIAAPAAPAAFPDAGIEIAWLLG